jgi:hypothetical protein
LSVQGSGFDQVPAVKHVPEAAGVRIDGDEYLGGDGNTATITEQLVANLAA